MEHQPFADDSQLYISSQPSDIDQTVLSVQNCVFDIKDWMTDNKLELNEDKTEAMLFNSSKLPDAPASFSICQTTFIRSYSVRNLGFYIDKDLTVKQLISFICKTAFFEVRRISLFGITSQLVPQNLVSPVLSRIDYCNSLLAGLPLSSSEGTKLCSPSCSSCILKCTVTTLSLITRLQMVLNCTNLKLLKHTLSIGPSNPFRWGGGRR